MPSEAPSPLEQAVKEEAVSRYHEALIRQRPRDRQLVVARIEAQWSHDEIARHFNLPTPDAARMAVARAFNRLLDSLKNH
jgi:DNA-directed RNA polymerase specialized sigma24 family protein